MMQVKTKSVKGPYDVPDWLTEDHIKDTWKEMCDEGVRKNLIRRTFDGIIIGKGNPSKWLNEV